MSQTIEIKAQLVWLVGPSRERGFVAACPPVGLTMHGDSLDDLYHNIQEAIQLLMTDLLEDGALDDFLRKHGWQKAVHGSVREASMSPVHFQVPISLLIDSNRDPARALS